MNATKFVRMPTSKQMLMMGIPELPEEAFGGDLPPMQRKALVQAMGIRPQGGGGGGLKAVIGVAAAIAIPFAAPAIVGAIASSTAIAASLPFVTAALSTTAGAVIGSAIVGAGLGAVTAKVTGGDVGRGALMGAIGGGIGGYSEAGNIVAQGQNVGTGATALTDAGTATLATTPTANAVVTNVGSNTGYWSPELGQFVDPMTGNTIAAQNIAYGGTVDSALASQLSQGGVNAQTLANSINSSGTLAVNTPGAIGGSAGAFGAGGGTYYDPTTAVAGSSPVYSQAGLQYTPAMEQAAANQAVQAGTMVNTPGTAATATTAATPAQTVQAATAPAVTGGATVAAPTTFSQALKQKFTDPKAQADMFLRAAGQLAGSTVAGDGLSDEEKQLLQQQTAELQQLRTTNQELFNQRLQEAQALIGESGYFNPAYFGMQAQRSVQTSGARAKRDALSKFGPKRAGLRAAEERRFDIGISTGGQTAYLQGADAAQQNRIRTQTAGLSAMPTGAPSGALQYGSYIGSLYDAADRRRRQNAGDIGDLFGSFTGSQQANSTGLPININFGKA
ncbi:hypothetical protein [Rheinheimera sp.]|uniref:hypothetical protein n=1 Tax=Rheinheimera sp. TaxID=1869214 RepID=UPI0040480473